MRNLQRVAMRMGCMASWSDESLLRRPPAQDRGCHRAGHAQGSGGSHLRGRDLHRQALRYQGPEGRAPRTRQGSWETAQDGRASRQAPRRGPKGAPVRHAEGALRVRGGHKRGFGEPLDHVPRHRQDRFDAQKGGRNATERDEFLRAAWRSMVAAEVDPSRLVFVDEMGLHTSLAPLYGYAPRGERVRLSLPRNRGKNTTLLASIGLDGMGETMAVEGYTDRGVFEAYVDHALAPTLEAGRVVIMDNLPAHKPARVRELIEERGFELIYLPAYSPDLNPIDICQPQCAFKHKLSYHWPRRAA